MSTYQDIYDSFNDLVGNSGNLFFSDATIDRFAGRALDESCERIRWIDHYDLIDSEIGVSEYAGAYEGYGLYRVEYDNLIMFPITRDQLRQQDRDWEYRQGLPKYYYTDELYVASGTEKPYFGLWERPSVDGSENIRVWYWRRPFSPSSSYKSNVVEIPSWASSLVLYYMLYLAYTADTKVQDEGAAAIYYALYEDVFDRLDMRSKDRQPKKWVSGDSSLPEFSVLNRLPRRVPAP